ncbi:hypothetical protein ACTHGP_06010 [[Pasteurella] aerogenes]
MDSIKLSLDDNQSYLIERELFEEKTRKRYPYYQENEKKEIEQFGICPECNNPVQIIGLYKKLLHTEKPYGKHYQKPIANLGRYNRENYEYCPYAAKRKEYTKESRKTNLDELAVSIINRMVTYFDKVIYALQKEIGIYISETLAAQMLRDYFGSRAYLYNGSTLRNLPLVLAYFSLNVNLVGRRVFSAELIESINKMPNLYVDEKQQVKSKYYSAVGFYFTQHRIQLIDHHLSEHILLVISQGDINHPEEIYRKKLVFDNLYIENLLNYHTEHLSEYSKRRNAVLLQLAKDIALEYGFKV